MAARKLRIISLRRDSRQICGVASRELGIAICRGGRRCGIEGSISSDTVAGENVAYVMPARLARQKCAAVMQRLPWKNEKACGRPDGEIMANSYQAHRLAYRTQTAGQSCVGCLLPRSALERKHFVALLFREMASAMTVT